MKENMINSTSPSRIFEKILNRFGFVKASPRAKGPSIYQFWRERASSQQLLDVCPPASNDPIPGILIKMGFPEGVVTLLAMDDATVSLFCGGGGGIIGLGGLAGPALVARELRRLAPEHSASFHVPLWRLTPAAGTVQFYLFAGGQTLGTQASQEELEQPGHPLSPLFRKYCQLMEEIRSVNEKCGG